MHTCRLLKGALFAVPLPLLLLLCALLLLLLLDVKRKLLRLPSAGRKKCN